MRSYPWLICCFLLGLILGSETLPAQKVKGGGDPFGREEAHPHMLRLDLMQLVIRQRNNSISGILHLSYEHKIRPAWSINTELASPYLLGRDGTRSLWPFASGTVGLGLGTRYYPSLARLQAQGNWQNHMSADYVSLLLGTRAKRSPGGNTATDRAPNWFTDNVSFSLLYGIQRRIYRYWFIDFTLGMKLSYGDPSRSLGPSLNLRTRWQLQPVTSLRLGLAF